jgi:N-acetylglucosaminyldiphosphoundecaprenol N-acetyl-beta-D-mannosaminyltransferase
VSLVDVSNQAQFVSAPFAPPMGVLRSRARTRPVWTHRSYTCSGVRIDGLGIDEAADQLLELGLRDLGAHVHLCNAYTLALAQSDDSYRTLLNDASLNLPDGTPVAWVGRALGVEVNGPTRGADVMLATMERGVPYGVKHYLYGATQETIDALVANLSERFPGIEIVGAEAPPFRALSPIEHAAAVRRLRLSGAHLVWVGLGTPKQDLFVAEFSQLVDAAFVPVGAAFDFLAGHKREAPQWMHGSGLEWIFRLMTEPRRLFGRYLWGNLRFVGSVRRSSRGAPKAPLASCV